MSDVTSITDQQVDAFIAAQGAAACETDLVGTERARFAIKAGLTALGLGPGKVILPKQPTSAMLEAGLKAVSGEFDEDSKATAWDALRFYRAMIAAAQENPHV